MAVDYIRRSTGIPANLSQKNGANSIRVEAADNTVRVGTGASGTSETQLQPVTALSPVVVTAATLTLSPALHDGRLVVLTNLAGCAVTLPAATGSGAKYTLIIGVLPTSGSVAVAVANGSDYMRGFAFVLDGSTASTFATANTATLATESDTITWNRTTTGLANIGDYIELVDFAANVWAVETEQSNSGTVATPFSAAV